MLFVCIAFLGIPTAIYCLAYHQTRYATTETFAEFGNTELHLLDVCPSRSHIVWFLWRIKFEKKHKYMPGDLVYWRLWPFGNVEFSK
jgi:hypothetical protein